MNIKAIGTSIKNLVIASFRGELLMRLGCDKVFLQIVYTFMLFWVMIMLNILVENTLSKVERNNDILTELQIYHTEKMVQLASMGRITKTEELLDNKGSKVCLQKKPAFRIDSDE